MQQKVIRKGKSDCLHLFFAGWGMDGDLQFLLPEEKEDLLLVFDYTDLEFEQTLIKEYNSFRLSAWSMGVWAAEQIELPRPIEAVAINGTPYPVHNDWGIPKEVFDGTLSTLSEQSLGRFYRRMCGSVEALQRFAAHAPKRSIESLKEELTQIGRESAQPSPFPKQWDRTVVGNRDLIFPTTNQLNYWGEKAETVELPHFIW